MAQESAALVGRPLEVGPEEPVDRAHDLHFEFGRQEAFKALFDCCVLREIDKTVHVEPEMERLVRGCGRGVFRQRYTLEEARIVKAGL